jgi:hypothetical protein
MYGQTMASDPKTGQARRAIDAAHAALVGTDASAADASFDVAGLLWAWRALAPRVHPWAASDVVDVDALAGVLARWPGATAGAAFVVGGDLGVVDVRAVTVFDRAARALADACTLGLEQEKLRHGLSAPAAALKAHFASPDAARATLMAVRDADVPVVAGVDVDIRVDVDVDRDALVVVGAGALRVYDLLSPYVRRHKVDLALVGRHGSAVDDDDVYRGLAALFARAPEALAERRAVEAEVGFVDGGGVFVVDVDALREDDVDRRARSLVAPLKRAHKGAALVGVVDVALLPAVLRQLSRVKAVRGLCRGTTSSHPRAFVDAADRGTYGFGADASLRSLPSLLLGSVDEDGVVGAVDVAAAAAAFGVDRGAVDVVAVAADADRDDDSAAGLAALAAVVAVAPGARGTR